MGALSISESKESGIVSERILTTSAQSSRASMNQEGHVSERGLAGVRPSRTVSVKQNRYSSTVETTRNDSLTVASASESVL